MLKMITCAQGEVSALSETAQFSPENAENREKRREKPPAAC